MGQRTVEGLFDLGREIGGRIIRGAMILAVRRLKFGLHKQTVSRDPLLGQRPLQRLAYQSFLVVNQIDSRCRWP